MSCPPYYINSAHPLVYDSSARDVAHCACAPTDQPTDRPHDLVHLIERLLALGAVASRRPGPTAAQLALDVVLHLVTWHLLRLGANHGRLGSAAAAAARRQARVRHVRPCGR